MRTVILAAALAVTGPAWALTVDCEQLLDVEKGRWISQARVVIEDGLVQSVGKADATPPDVQAGRYCLPGLMDMHVHLSGEIQPQSVSWRENLTLDPADRALRMPVYAERTLRAGFTTVRDLGASDDLNIALKRAIEQGWVQGPRIYSSGKSLATTGGHADPTNSLNAELSAALGAPGPVEGVINGPASAWQAVRQRYKDGADLIKITATGGVLSQASSGQNAQFTDAELAAIVAAAKDYGFRVAAHAHGAEGMKRAIRAGVDSIEHATLMDDEAIRLFKKHKTWYVPTLLAGKYVMEKAADPAYFSPLVLPKVLAIGPKLMDTFSRALKAGVRIAFGTDSGVSLHGDNAREFLYMIEGGMSPLAAIRSATLAAAELLGQEKNLGQVAPGFRADLIAVDTNPLEDIAALMQVHFVMKDGVVVRTP